MTKIGTGFIQWSDWNVRGRWGLKRPDFFKFFFCISRMSPLWCIPCKWYRKYFWNYLNFWCRLHALRYQYLSCFRLSATCEYTSIKSRQDICTWTSVLPDFKVGHSRLLNFVFFFTDTISYLKLDTFNITLTA